MERAREYTFFFWNDEFISSPPIQLQHLQGFSLPFPFHIYNLPSLISDVVWNQGSNRGLCSEATWIILHMYGSYYFGIQMDSLFCLYFFPPCWLNFWMCKICAMLKSQNYMKSIHLLAPYEQTKLLYDKMFSYIHTHKVTNSLFLVCNLNPGLWSKDIISLCFYAISLTS